MYARAYFLVHPLKLTELTFSIAVILPSPPTSTKMQKIYRWKCQTNHPTSKTTNCMCFVIIFLIVALSCCFALLTFLHFLSCYYDILMIFERACLYFNNWPWNSVWDRAYKSNKYVRDELSWLKYPLLLLNQN